MLPRIAIGLGLVAAGWAAENSAARAMRLVREGTAAHEAGNPGERLAKMEEAADLRPDYPRMLTHLAAAQLGNGRPDDALATLERLAKLGFSSTVDQSEEFKPLSARKEFQAIAKRLAANAHPVGSGEIAFSLRSVTGLIEGIAWRANTGEFYFGDVNGRAVWVRRKDESLHRFTPEGDDLLGVFGLAIDEAAGTLWAATSAVPAMRGFAPEMEGAAALAEIDLATGAVRRVIPLPKRPGDSLPHVLGDLALAEDGAVWLTDSGGTQLWRLPPGGVALEPWVESDEFMSMQGIVVLGGVAIVADHANGLLRVDLGARKVSRLESPPDTTLIGLDGLALALDGQLLAIQNGLRPKRILRIELEGEAEAIAAVKVLESGHIAMAAPSLGCIGPGGDFHYVGNAGWTRFENTDGRPTAPRIVPVYRTKLPKNRR